MRLGSEKAGKNQFADVGLNTEIIWSLGKKNFWQIKKNGLYNGKTSSIMFINVLGRQGN